MIENLPELSPIQRRALRAAAHPLQPVVAISQKEGLSPAVLKEISASLKSHELIKVKLHGIERDAHAALLAEICAQLDCAPVQHIGNILILWRENSAKEAAAATKPRRKPPAPRNKKEAAAALEKKARKK